MVKFYSSNFSYDYSFPAVSLAYFLRYPNPYSTHVLSSDVIERHFDPETQRLTTVRLHLKRSKLPPAVLKLVPRSILGASKEGDSQSYILETSVVDVKEGTMETESRNLEWTGILSVIEKQVYKRPLGLITGTGSAGDPFSGVAPQKTDVTTTVILKSRIGENLRKRRARIAESSSDDEEAPAKVGFFRSWANDSMQRSIELIGLRRAEGSQPKAKMGMTVVLERMRQGGLGAVLEGMRRDRELMFAGPPPVPALSNERNSAALDIDYDE
ncbi:hypothetical protein H2203_004975 [Taxawa tesnikishii (nom. ined.)]|nr:hypothetical protein H2203_004975 [Dothideales sp. JES 119]